MTGEEKIKQQNPFRVPDNYFEDVSRKIISRTAGTEKPVKHPIYRSMRPFLAVAAGLAILITIGYFSTRLSGRPESYQEISQLMISEPELFLNELDLLTLENSDLLDDGSYDQVLSDDEIIDYLVSEDIDISLILEKL